MCIFLRAIEHENQHTPSSASTVRLNRNRLIVFSHSFCFFFFRGFDVFLVKSFIITDSMIFSQFYASTNASTIENDNPLVGNTLSFALEIVRDVSFLETSPEIKEPSSRHRTSRICVAAKREKKKRETFLLVIENPVELRQFLSVVRSPTYYYLGTARRMLRFFS